MGKARTLFALTLALSVTSVCQAAQLFKTDFTKNAEGWTLNETAQLLKIEGDATRPQVLSLTQNEGSQTGTAWTNMAFRVTSFSYIADIRIRFDAPNAGDCPADGAAMAFAPVPADTVGGGGGSLGLFGGALETFTAFEINTWRDQGAGDEADRGECANEQGKDVTFAIDVVNPQTEDPSRTPGAMGTPEAGGAKIGQVAAPQGMKIVNGGWYRYQWNVAENGTHTVFVTGLEDANKQFQKVKALEVKFPNNNAINFEGRFGLTAATGGAVQHTEVAAAEAHSPVIDAQ